MMQKIAVLLLKFSRHFYLNLFILIEIQKFAKLKRMNFLSIIFLLSCQLFHAHCLSEEDRDLALSIHNNLRRDVAVGACKDKSGKVLPKASNMKEIVKLNPLSKNNF